MASSTLRLRRLWFSVHKWIGILLALAIIPIALTGSALVWHDWLDRVAHPARHAVSGGDAVLPPSAYAAAVAPRMEPGERIASIRMPEHRGPVVVTAAKARSGPPRPGPPPRTLYYLNPADARLLDKADGNAGVTRLFHRLHGSLLVPGVGRQIVGWAGVAMLLSAISGLWLWWPVSGSWRRGLRWKRSPSAVTNLHHQGGFWISLPLAVLAFTGVWISFPAFFGALSGAEAPKRPPPSPPLVATGTSPDAVLAAARPLASGAVASLTWPTEASPRWKVGFEGAGTPEVLVEDAGGRALPPDPPKPEATARLMRRVHDGTGMGAVWQTVIFLGGLIPAGLAVTGIWMWLRGRRWRGEAKRRKAGRVGAVVPAE